MTSFSAVGESDTAFSGGRTPGFNLFTIAVGPTPDLLDADRAWVRNLMAELEPLTVDRVYINALDDDGTELDITYNAGVNGLGHRCFGGFTGQRTP